LMVWPMLSATSCSAQGVSQGQCKSGTCMSVW
jgi:hypothetical protein